MLVLAIFAALLNFALVGTLCLTLLKATAQVQSLNDLGFLSPKIVVDAVFR
jgi:flagellar biosynthesis protein FliQ